MSGGALVTDEQHLGYPIFVVAPDRELGIVEQARVHEKQPSCEMLGWLPDPALWVGVRESERGRRVVVSEPQASPISIER